MKLTQLLSLIVLSTSLSACSIFARDEEKQEEPKAVQAAPVQQAPETPKEDHSHSQTAHEVHWSYSGDTGPEHWGDLKPEYSLCKTGEQQSPIDLVYKKPQTGREIKTSYQSTPVKIIDNGHTIQVNFEPGNSIEIEGERFNLLHAEFHSSSEHAIAGNLLPMEMHLTHKSDAGDLAILGVILIEGATHPIVESVWQSIPIQKGMEKEVSFTINPEDLIPRTRTYYNYSGSLTTPPCSEGVNWNVFNTPVTMSKEQIMTFRQLYPSNNRPLQPLGQRRTVNFR